MKILALIPARMGSSRFPGKPLAEILGKPMIGHVYNRVASCEILTETVVATCDLQIFDYIVSIGGKAVLTSAHHERASDRCAEALEILETENGCEYEIVVMVQGDEPMTHPEMIKQAVEPLVTDSSVHITNLYAEITSSEEFLDPNCIKVVLDSESDAIYFSRSPVPNAKKFSDVSAKKQVCIIPFRRHFLLEYTAMEPTPLEKVESIDMLRIIEHGKKVRMVMTERPSHAVDTPEDLRVVQKLMAAPRFV